MHLSCSVWEHKSEGPHTGKKEFIVYGEMVLTTSGKEQQELAQDLWPSPSHMFSHVRIWDVSSLQWTSSWRTASKCNRTSLRVWFVWVRRNLWPGVRAVWWFSSRSSWWESQDAKDRSDLRPIHPQTQTDAEVYVHMIWLIVDAEVKSNGFVWCQGLFLGNLVVLSLCVPEKFIWWKEQKGNKSLVLLKP